MNPIDNSKKPLLNDHIIETQRLVQGLETGILYSVRILLKKKHFFQKSFFI